MSYTRALPMRALVVTPTYNEAENIGPFVSAVLEASAQVEVLVVDDASPDGTGAIVDEIASREPRVHVIHRGAKLGLGTAYVEGFSWGLERGFDQLFEMDADFSHAPSDLPRLMSALERADVVIGSRNIPGGGVEGWGLGRHVLSRGGSMYARTILGVGVRDLTSGFKGYTSRALSLIEIRSIESNGYSFQIETTFRAIRRGLRVVEVPIVFVDRRAGQSKMSRRIFAEAVWMVWKLRIDAARARKSDLSARPARVSPNRRAIPRKLRVFLASRGGEECALQTLRCEHRNGVLFSVGVRPNG